MGCMRGSGRVGRSGAWAFVFSPLAATRYPPVYCAQQLVLLEAHMILHMAPRLAAHQQAGFPEALAVDLEICLRQAARLSGISGPFAGRQGGGRRSCMLRCRWTSASKQ